MSKRKTGPRPGPTGPNEKRHKRTCLWCGVSFHAAKPQAKTCSNPHRQLLNRYVKRHGAPPLFPFQEGAKPYRKTTRGRPNPNPRCAPLPPRKGGAK